MAFELYTFNTFSLHNPLSVSIVLHLHKSCLPAAKHFHFPALTPSTHDRPDPARVLLKSVREGAPSFMRRNSTLVSLF